MGWWIGRLRPGFVASVPNWFLTGPAVTSNFANPSLGKAGFPRAAQGAPWYLLAKQKKQWPWGACGASRSQVTCLYSHPQISCTLPLTSVPISSPPCKGGRFRSPWAPLILLTRVCHMKADHELLKVCRTLIYSLTIQQCFLQLQSSCQNLINDHVSHIFFLLQKEYFFLLLI